MAEGRGGYAAPQVVGTATPFRSELRGHLKGHSEGLEDLAVEMLARGLSVRDIEDAFREESGRLLLSRMSIGSRSRSAPRSSLAIPAPMSAATSSATHCTICRCWRRSRAPWTRRRR